MRTTRYALLLLACVLPSIRSAHADPPPELARWLAPQAWDKDTPGPILSLGKTGDFDDMHIFAPTVALEQDKYSLWYCGSQGSRGNRVFRLGLATGSDGKQFARSPGNPVLQFADGEHSILTPCLLRSGDGNVLRENGKLRMWFSSAAFKKGPLHTLHEATSDDGIHWSEPSAAQLENLYCPSVLKSDTGYQMWFVDVSKRPWVVRYAESADGVKWNVNERVVLQLSQPWEAEIMVYPCVLKVDGVYLMWYGSYYSAVRRQTTAIGFAASTDGLSWHKHPENPVLKPDEKRPWESHYVTSGSVMRLPDGSFRFWYASRTAPPFVHLYYAINTARWNGPPAEQKQAVLPLPPKKGDAGSLPRLTVDVLEVIDATNAIVRVWNGPSTDGVSFVDCWVQGADTSDWRAGETAPLRGSLQCTGTKVFDTTCGGRSVPLLEAAP